ncbi:MAG: uncharacterized protein KVP18_004004 [Porospora cf. gigantea A]|uniref:uncharacterized protein n=1 Tax=Porospora cf. gigantea A TaxID=2853593 RepID=UPI00355A38B7|nr:MAG: hypothetical protein KVP18_004004 [Porospora cf. gigantea A]
MEVIVDVTAHDTNELLASVSAPLIEMENRGRELFLFQQEKNNLKKVGVINLQVHVIHDEDARATEVNLPTEVWDFALPRTFDAVKSHPRPPSVEVKASAEEVEPQDVDFYIRHFLDLERTETPPPLLFGDSLPDEIVHTGEIFSPDQAVGRLFKTTGLGSTRSWHAVFNAEVDKAIRSSLGTLYASEDPVHVASLLKLFEASARPLAVASFFELAARELGEAIIDVASAAALESNSLARPLYVLDPAQEEQASLSAESANLLEFIRDSSRTCHTSILGVTPVEPSHPAIAFRLFEKDLVFASDKGLLAILVMGDERTSIAQAQKVYTREVAAQLVANDALVLLKARRFMQYLCQAQILDPFEFARAISGRKLSLLDLSMFCIVDFRGMRVVVRPYHPRTAHRAQTTPDLSTELDELSRLLHVKDLHRAAVLSSPDGKSPTMFLHRLHRLHVRLKNGEVLTLRSLTTSVSDDTDVEIYKAMDDLRVFRERYGLFPLSQPAYNRVNALFLAPPSHRVTGNHSACRRAYLQSQLVGDNFWPNSRLYSTLLDRKRARERIQRFHVNHLRRVTLELESLQLTGLGDSEGVSAFLHARGVPLGCLGRLATHTSHVWLRAALLTNIAARTVGDLHRRCMSTLVTAFNWDFLQADMEVGILQTRVALVAKQSKSAGTHNSAFWTSRGIEEAELLSDYDLSKALYDVSPYLHDLVASAAAGERLPFGILDLVTLNLFNLLLGRSVESSEFWSLYMGPACAAKFPGVLSADITPGTIPAPGLFMEAQCVCTTRFVTHVDDLARRIESAHAQRENPERLLTVMAGGPFMEKPGDTHFSGAYPLMPSDLARVVAVRSKTSTRGLLACLPVQFFLANPARVHLPLKGIALGSADGHVISTPVTSVYSCKTCATASVRGGRCCSSPSEQFTCRQMQVALNRCESLPWLVAQTLEVREERMGENFPVLARFESGMTWPEIQAHADLYWWLCRQGWYKFAVARAQNLRQAYSKHDMKGVILTLIVATLAVAHHSSLVRVGADSILTRQRVATMLQQVTSLSRTLLGDSTPLALTVSLMNAWVSADSGTGDFFRMLEKPAKDLIRSVSGEGTDVGSFLSSGSFTASLCAASVVASGLDLAARSMLRPERTDYVETLRQLIHVAEQAHSCILQRLGPCARATDAAVRVICLYSLLLRAGADSTEPQMVADLCLKCYNERKSHGADWEVLECLDLMCHLAPSQYEKICWWFVVVIHTTQQRASNEAILTLETPEQERAFDAMRASWSMEGLMVSVGLKAIRRPRLATSSWLACLPDGAFGKPPSRPAKQAKRQLLQLIFNLQPQQKEGAFMSGVLRMVLDLDEVLSRAQEHWIGSQQPWNPPGDFLLPRPVSAVPVDRGVNRGYTLHPPGGRPERARMSCIDKVVHLLTYFSPPLSREELVAGDGLSGTFPVLQPHDHLDQVDPCTLDPLVHFWKVLREAQSEVKTVVIRTVHFADHPILNYPATDYPHCTRLLSAVSSFTSRETFAAWNRTFEDMGGG